MGAKPSRSSRKKSVSLSSSNTNTTTATTATPTTASSSLPSSTTSSASSSLNNSSSSNGSSSPASLWEWQNDNGTSWQAYDAQTSALLETAHQNGTTTVSLNHGYFAKGGGYTVNLSSMTQIRNSTNHSRPIRRNPSAASSTTTSSSSSSSSSGVTWEWQDDNSSWKSYDAQTTSLIEAAHQGGQTSLQLTHGFFGKQGGYTIDLSSMQQTKNSTNYTRQIRRVPPPSSSPSSSSSSSSSSSLSSSSSATTATPSGPTWEYELEEGKWETYDRLTARLLEGSATGGRKSVVLNHAQYSGAGAHCVVDFEEMTQTKPSTGDSLKIRRTPPLPSSNSSSSSSLSKSGGKKDKEKEKVGKEAEEERGFGGVEQNKIQKLKKLTQWKKVDKVSEEETCPICFCDFEVDGGDDSCAVLLNKCSGHFFHPNCIVHCFKSDYLQCPCCSMVYGVRVGTQPNGTMSVTRYEKGGCTLSGHSDVGTIQISYHFPDGVQGPQHPNPGQSYSGTSRVAYLPDNKEGNEVLQLLEVAWERKLLFQIGTSVTTGQTNTVVWNGVHHKTSTSGGPTSYGYPDETYFERVKGELEDKGVTLADIKGRKPLQNFIFGRNWRRRQWFFLDLAKKYGAYNVWIFKHRHVILTQPDLVDYVLNRNFRNYERGHARRSLFRELLGDGIFTADGRSWMLHRKLAKPLFRSTFIAHGMVPVFDKHIRHHLFTAFQEAARSGKPLDLLQLFMSFTMGTFLELGLGCKDGTLTEKQRQKFQACFEGAQGGIVRRLLNPLTGFIASRDIRKCVAYIDKHVYAIIQQRKQESMKELRSKTDIFSQFLALTDDDGQPLSAKYLRDVFLNFLLAGRDTTATTLTWAFYCICKNRDVAQRLTKEIQDVVIGEIPTMDEIQRMTFAKNVITEALRLFPPVAFNGRMAAEDDVLPNGVKIFAGDELIYSPFCMGRLEYEDAERFDPDRWTEERAQHYHKGLFSSFHLGPQTCLGKDMAYTEAVQTMCALLKHYKVRLVPGEEEKNSFKASILLTPSGGMLVTVKPRQKQQKERGMDLCQ
ncbi:E3 ubiquitin-protein ligase [Balamuthia mandrillaris]